MMKKLQQLAKEYGCEVEDDKANATLYVHAPEGKAWEEGELHALVECYGSSGSYLPEWRQRAITDMIESLKANGKPEDEE